MINWEELRQQYISGRISCRELAAMHGIPVNTVERHCARGHWVKDRKEALAAGAENVREKLVDSMDDAMRGLVEQYSRISEIAMIKQQAMIEDPASVKTGDILTIARSLEILIGIYRSLFDVPTQAVAFSQGIARERLDLEREKLHMAQDQLHAGAPCEMKILITGYSEEESELLGG